MKRFSTHNHTMYSNIRLLDSTNRPEKLIEYGKEIGLSGLAITDHEALCGAVKFNQLQQRDLDFKIGLGNEIYLVDERDMGIRYYHFLLIALDKIGFKQLRKLSSIAWLNSYYDRGMERVPTTKEELASVISQDPGHVVATTACIGGELSASVLEMEKARKMGDDRTAALKYQQIVRFIELCQRIFKDNFYIECAPSANKEQIIVNQKLAQIASLYNIKMVIGDDSHYLKRTDRYVHEAYLNSKGGEREVATFYEYAYLHNEEELYQDLRPSYVDGQIDKMIENSAEIYDKIEVFDLAHTQTIPMVPIPEVPKAVCKNENFKETYPVLSELCESDDNYDRYWVKECLNKLNEKGLWRSEYLKELEYEADIKKAVGERLGTNVFAYPITLKYYIDMMWDCGSLVGAGRGSSCTGLNHYLLGVTQLDPLKWDLKFWRYLNKDRIEMPDIDIDLCPSKKKMIVNKIKEERGQRFNNDIDTISRKNLGCVLIATFGTEGTKSAILTACRGYRSEDYPDGIDNDEAQYLASLIPSERGFLWPIEDVLNGNPDKDRKPVDTFIREINQFPGLLDIIIGIQGLVNKRSSHASGVIFADEDPYKFLAYMRTPKGEVITQYDLHDSEYCGVTKYDFLVTEVQDKIAQTLKMLQANGYFDKNATLREIYETHFHPEVIDAEDKEVWAKIQDASILNIFQFDSNIGKQGAKKIKPSNILELTDANGLIRLLPDKDAETPMDKYIRQKRDIKIWYNEMDRWGLTKEEQKVLEPYFKPSYGVPPSQEQLMEMLMDENTCGFSLKEANAARKVVAKKQMAKIPELHQQVIERAKSEKLGEYIWKFGAGPQMGYSFAKPHALAYSFIGYQTAYLATKYPSVYWNTACLIVNSGGLDEEFLLETDEDDNPTSNVKDSQTDYAKIAKALGEIISQGIKVSLVDINRSDFTFVPDEDNNQIIFGLKALGGVNSEIIDKIKKGRPYSSLKDFMIRCPLPKTPMISLIKSGAFDGIEKENALKIGYDEPRIFVMGYYLSIVSEPKKKLNLQNWPTLMKMGLIPDDMSYYKRVYEFNRYMKAHKVGATYLFDERGKSFIDENDYDLNLNYINGQYEVQQKDWDKIYKSEMDGARLWLAENQQEVLWTINKEQFKIYWDKYAQGNVSAWEMSAMCFYYHPHELLYVDKKRYGIVDFDKLSVQPQVEKTFKRNGKEIPIFMLHRIVGTVIGKNDTRHSISLLTTEGVVNVKFSRDYYAMYNKQISEVLPDGSKKVLEKGWFTRGTKLMINGFRRDDTFNAKNYKSNAGHQLYKIVEVQGNELVLEHERAGGSHEET